MPLMNLPNNIPSLPAATTGMMPAARSWRNADVYWVSRAQSFLL